MDGRSDIMTRKLLNFPRVKFGRIGSSRSISVDKGEYWLRWPIEYLRFK